MKACLAFTHLSSPPITAMVQSLPQFYNYKEDMALILFIDDDPQMLEMLEKSVQFFGHQAITAKSGADALRLAVEQAPDLIMTDMMLPDIDGVELIKQLHHLDATATIPVVILSASPEVDLEYLSEMAGADSYLSKPVHLQSLQEVIDRYTTSDNDGNFGVD
jgi:DNA-binding response OmpR family regulator